MARPVSRPATTMKALRLDSDLCDQVDKARGEQPFTHAVEDALRRWLKAMRKAKA